jgi:hypothetical protein
MALYGVSVRAASPSAEPMDQIDPRLDNRPLGLSVGSPPHSRRSAEGSRRSVHDPKLPFVSFTAARKIGSALNAADGRTEMDRGVATASIESYITS